MVLEDDLYEHFHAQGDYFVASDCLFVERRPGGTGCGPTASGSISGTVKDSAGAAIDGAEVTLVHMQSVLRTSVTNADGKFTIDNVAPGSYAVIVKRSDFGRFSVAVQVNPGDKKDLEVMLEVNPLANRSR